MALTLHSSQVGPRREVAAGATKTFQWNNPPGGVITYSVRCDPPTPSGPHGTASGEVGITSIRHTYVKDNYNSNSAHYEIDVKNYGTSTTGFIIIQTWVTDD
jgi:hypothetical protein